MPAWFGPPPTHSTFTYWTTEPTFEVLANSMPSQFPRAGEPAADVKTIVSVTAPCAISFPPTSSPVPGENATTVPASIVNVTPAGTVIDPPTVTGLLASVHVVSAEMTPLTCASSVDAPNRLTAKKDKKKRTERMAPPGDVYIEVAGKRWGPCQSSDEVGARIKDDGFS